MNFMTAIDTLPKEYLKFRGTAQRSEFLWKILIMFGANIAYGLTFTLLVKADAFKRLNFGQEAMLLVAVIGIAAIAWLIYAIPLCVRRLKDTGVSGWWYLVVVIFTCILGFTWVLAWLGGLINLALIAYLVFMPSAGAKGISVAKRA